MAEILYYGSIIGLLVVAMFGWDHAGKPSFAPFRQALLFMFFLFIVSCMLMINQATLG